MKRAACPGRSFFAPGAGRPDPKEWTSCCRGFPAGRTPFLEEQGRAWYATRWYGEVSEARGACEEELIRQLAILHRVLEEDRGRRRRFGTGRRKLVERWRDQGAGSGIRQQTEDPRVCLSLEQMLGDHAELLDKAFSFAVRNGAVCGDGRGFLPVTLCHGGFTHNLLKGRDGSGSMGSRPGGQPNAGSRPVFRQFSNSAQGSGILFPPFDL